MKPQINRGSIAFSYSPYFTPIKLRKSQDGTYSDYIQGLPNNWSIKRKIGSVVLDGSENYENAGLISNVRRYSIALTNVKLNDANNPKLSDHFTYNYDYNLDEPHFYISNNGGIFIFSTYTDGTQFKNWLSTTKPEFEYPLATETTEAITNQEIINQLNEIYYLQGYNGTTNITITSEDLELIMTANTYKNTLDGKYDSLDDKKADKTDIPTKVSELENDSGFLTEHQDLTDYVKNTDYANSTKGGVIKVAPTVYMTSADSGGYLKGSTKTYSEYTNPSISNDALICKGTLEQVITGKQLVSKSVNDLTNYYLKNEIFTKQEVNNLINAITTLNLLIVQSLPTQDISTTTIYLVPKSTSETNNVYDEYVYINNSWEKIGDTQIDLSNYITTTQLNTALADYTTTANLTTLLSGKQNTIDSTHKLDADLIDDTNSTNKFVSSSEKTTWNSKQNAVLSGTNSPTSNLGENGDIYFQYSE